MNYFLKRWLDLTLGCTGLVVSAPLWLLFAVAVKLEDGGRVFYRQQRVGKDGQIFHILKFRTLLTDADRVVRPWMTPDEQWITKVGSFLRGTALDELPQLLNIVKGEMSFVGPRAMPADEFRDFQHKIPGLEKRLAVRPGLTGLAQVYGKATRNARSKLRYDLLYVKRQSPCLDLKLVGFSFWITFQGKWENLGKRPGVSGGWSRRGQAREIVGKQDMTSYESHREEEKR